ncbi:MAG TPA: hypothetical protein VGQ13_00035 [Nitrososphaera sp.]|nr:hypothetical protein [Nitrososphaera sp.]
MAFLTKRFNSYTVQAMDLHLKSHGVRIFQICDNLGLFKKELFTMFNAGSESIESEIIVEIFREFGYNTDETDLEAALLLLKQVTNEMENEGINSLLSSQDDDDSSSETKGSRNKNLGATFLFSKKRNLKLYKCKNCPVVFLFRQDMENHKKEKNHLDFEIETFVSEYDGSRK